MANLLAPAGFQISRPNYGGGATFQANQFSIKRAYATAIGIGDVVKPGVGTNLGYIELATTVDTEILGIFAGVLPYYDTNMQAIAHGLNGSYVATALPPAGVDIQCLVYSGPELVFRAQVNGAPLQTWIGKNANFRLNGAPNISGISTAGIDVDTIDVTNTLPFRIVGFVGVAGGPQDPTQTNPWVEVRMNTPEAFTRVGV